MRGQHLVNEFLVLREAMTSHLTENDQGKAWRLLQALDDQLASADRSLRPERKLVGRFLESMSLLAGRRGETASRRDGKGGLGSMR